LDGLIDFEKEDRFMANADADFTMDRDIQIASARGQHRFSTDSLSIIHERMSRKFLPHRLDRKFSGTTLEFDHHWIPFPSFHINMISYNDGVRVIGEQPPDEWFCLQFTIQGTCEVGNGQARYELNPNQVFILNLGKPVYQDMEAGYRQINVQVKRSAAERLLAQSLGGVSRPKLQFPDVPMALNGDLESLFRYVGDLIHARAYVLMMLNVPAVERQIDQAFLTMLLCALPNDYQQRLKELDDGPPKPYYIRKAEAFMKANVNELITLQDIVSVSGVAERTLHNAFRQHLGLTPLAFLKNHRLEVVRRILMDPANARRTVTDIAFEHGFMHMSKFADDYKRRFGETPTMTRWKAP
jgi:AraC-like DNA-binding protein